MDVAILIFEFIVLIFSAVLHEVAHGFVAERLGDDTARKAGRLTLNPLKHLDPFLSIFMPIILFLTTGFFFAGAKPVPYDPRNLKDPRSGSVKIALAGPATNILLAAFFGVLSVAWPIAQTVKTSLVIAIMQGSYPASLDSLQGMYFLFLIIIYINILLGIFNLVPIPPLDGSRVLFAALPQTQTTYKVAYFLERWGLIFVLVFVFFGFQIIYPVMNFLFAIFTGQGG